ncbi:MAG UNVERIFIED_CONTAM: 3-hydroxybutyrate dehydrogenase [Rickettsiaceae bacterium]|jgi:3-hydroxybutyrate dehydrogenase
MKGKNALITGSTSGIGLGIAKHLASRGVNIALNGFGDKNEIQNLCLELHNQYNVKVLYAEADMSIPEQITSMMDEIILELGGIDILVNNAGIQHVSPIEDFPSNKLEAIIRIDLIAAFYTIKSVVPIMKKNNWGRIINIASAHALVASPFKSAYVAAKHGLLGMTKSIALEVAEYGITANAICPGYVKTPLVLGQVADTAKARNMSEEDVIKNVILGAQATKKFVEIEQIAAFVEFLCSDAAASITGAPLPIDGGWTAH